ncbi:hypothetical protein VAWG002_21110 [Aeromonas veronii]|nr:hypothetical protein VAWG002_21110 [Aeromonas veronii]
MGGAIEVIAIALTAGGLFAVITVGIIAGVTGFAIAAPAAAVTLVITVWRWYSPDSCPQKGVVIRLQTG